MKEVLFEIFGVTGIVLMVFAMFASILYLARCMVADTADFYDYFQHRTEFQMWKWVKEREEGEALEIQEQRCLEKLKEIRREKIRRDGRRPAMRVYTFIIPYGYDRNRYD